MSIPLSLSLSQLTWASKEVPPANSRRAFALLQVTGGETNQELPCHQAKNNINTFNCTCRHVDLTLQLTCMELSSPPLEAEVAFF
jgi:hypothetical protein